MKINNISEIKYNCPVVNKTISKAVTPEFKKADESSLNLIGNIGKAQLMLSFKGANPNRTIVKDLTPSEYRDMEDYVDELYFNLPVSLQKNLNFEELIDTYAIFVADKILENDELIENTDFQQYIRRIIADSQTREKAQAKCDIIDKLTQTQGLLRHKGASKAFAKIVLGTNSAQNFEAKSNFIDKVLSTPGLSENQSIMRNLLGITARITTPQNAKYRLDITDKFLKNKELLGNPNTAKEAGAFLYFTQTEAQYKIADKILSNKKLYNNPDVIKCAQNILMFSKYPRSANCYELILDKLYRNEINTNSFRDISSLIEEIIKSAEIDSDNDKEDQERLLSFRMHALEIFLQDEKFIKNPKSYSNAQRVISNIYDEDQKNLVIGIPNKALSEADADFLREAIVYANDNNEAIYTILNSDDKAKTNETIQSYIMEITGSVNSPAELHLFRKIMSDPRLYENEFVIEDIATIMSDVNSMKIAEIKCATIDALIDYEEDADDGIFECYLTD
ncbi:hypothetical protein II906_12625, partial [bacterium]|nr:hypothetical protein [bacterium]